MPYRIAALASFTSYTIGHNLGATVFTGGAVRFRIYSAWGLGIIDVAKIAFVTGLTFWLGNAFVLGVGMAYAPEAASALNQLPPWLNRLDRAGRARGHRRLPDLAAAAAARDRPRQLADYAAECAADAGADRHRCPRSRCRARSPCTRCCRRDPSVDFITVLVIFVMATLLGFLSHAPGSLGVFDAAMLIGLPQFEKEQLLASLLIFRVLYFVLPLFLAVLVLGIRELWFSAGGDAKRGELP